MVAFHTHTLPTATKEEAEAGLRDDIALSPASLYGAFLPILLPSEGEDEVVGGIITIGPDAPIVPSVGDAWIDTNADAYSGGGPGGEGGIPEAPFDGQQYARQNGAWQVVVVDGGGGGGVEGDDLDTTPVAAADSSLARVMPDWLAGSPVIDCPGDVLVAPNHRGAWLHMQSSINCYIILPDDWQPGMAFGARQIGTGEVFWQLSGGATLQLPFSKAGHTGLASQYEEAVFKVVANSDGSHAVWGVSGGTF